MLFSVTQMIGAHNHHLPIININELTKVRDHETRNVPAKNYGAKNKK